MLEIRNIFKPKTPMHKAYYKAFFMLGVLVVLCILNIYRLLVVEDYIDKTIYLLSTIVWIYFISKNIPMLKNFILLSPIDFKTKEMKQFIYCRVLNRHEFVYGNKIGSDDKTIRICRRCSTIQKLIDNKWVLSKIDKTNQEMYQYQWDEPLGE